MKRSTHSREYAALRAELRDARASAGLSQRELAARLDIPHSWVAKVENGERRIDLIEFGWFLCACGIDPIPPCQRLLELVRRKRPSKRVKGGQLK